jgi:hypothetical protein
MQDAVDAAARAGRTALLGDCAPGLEHTAPRAATVLRRVCNGPLAAIFNRPSDVDLDGELCAVSLRELPHEFVPAATLLLAQWLWTRVRSRPRRRHIVLDEVGALCMHAPLRELLVQLARRCRKYGASLVVATQNVEDLLRTEEGTVVATNCATVLLGGHRAAEARQMERAFGLTDGQRRFVEHAARGEFLLLAGRRRCEIRVDMPALHRSILVPDAAAATLPSLDGHWEPAAGYLPLDVPDDTDQHMGAAGRANPKMWDNCGSRRPGAQSSQRHRTAAPRRDH